MESRPRIRSGIFVTTPIFEKDRDRFKLVSPEELARRMRLNREEEVLVTVRRTDPIEIVLPHHFVAFLKDLIFNKKVQKEDLKFEVGFMLYEYINPLLRIMGISASGLTIYYYEPMEFELKIERDNDFNVDAAEIYASKFTILPVEKPTDHIRLYGRILNREDDYDLSYLKLYIGLYQILKDLKIKWDTSLR